MKVVHRKDAKALKGDKSLSYQVITPDNVGSRKFLVTVVDIRPGGSTPVHEHRTVESMYYVLEGRGEVTSGYGGVFSRRLDARNPERRQVAPSVPVLPRAAIRDRGLVSELASARRARDHGRMTTRRRTRGAYGRIIV